MKTNNIGPSFQTTIVNHDFDGINHVQEALAMVGDEYALVGYVPASAASVNIFVDGLYQLQGVDYIIDGRKIQFVEALAGGETVTASYLTKNVVANIDYVAIAFDIPGQDVRMGSHGSLQVLVSDGEGGYVWHDATASRHPITGDITFNVVQDPSPNQ